MNFEPCSCTRSPSSRQNGTRSSLSIDAYPGTISPAAVDAAPRGDDGSDARTREPDLPVDPRLLAGPVPAVEASRDTRAEHPVSHLEIPEPERLEDGIGHDPANWGGSYTERISSTISSRESNRLSS